MAIRQGDVVKFHYTGKFQNDQVFSTSKEDGLAECRIGEGKIIKAVEEGLINMEVGQKKEILVTPEKGYGVRSDTLIKSFPKKAFTQFDGKEGEIVHLRNEKGKIFSGRVVSIGDKEIILDLNHPLASKTLTFEVEVVGIQ